MTGWRIGFAAAPPPVARAMSNLQDQVTSNPTSFAQYGAVAAFDLPWESVEAMRAEFEARRDFVVNGLSSIPGVSIRPPRGAFYAFADVRALLLPGESDAEFADALLNQAKIAVVPGSVFEGPGHIRMSYATDRETLRRGIERLADFVSQRSA